MEFGEIVVAVVTRLDPGKIDSAMIELEVTERWEASAISGRTRTVFGQVDEALTKRKRILF